MTARRRDTNFVRAIEMDVVPNGAAERLEELHAERDALARALEEADAALPSVKSLAAWVRRRLCAKSADTLLVRAVGRCAIDSEGTVHVEIPWMGRPKTVL